MSNDELQSDEKNCYKPFLIISIAGLLIYAQAILFPFSNYDDYSFIVMNSHIHEISFENLKTLWVPGLYEGEPIYNPLSYTVLMFLYAIGSGDPLPFHLFNVLLHIGSACILFKILLSLKVDHKVALIVSLFFIAHPVQSEAVAWAFGLKDLLAAILALSAFYYYLNDRKNRCLVFYLLACLAKPSVLLLAVFFAVYRLLKDRKFVPRDLVYLAVSVLIVILNQIQSHVQQSIHVVGESTVSMSTNNLSYIFMVPLAILQRLIPYMPFPRFFNRPETVSQFSMITGMVLGIALLIILIELYRRKKNDSICGLFFFILLFCPVAAVVISNRAFYMADRYLYLPLVGLLMLIPQFLTTKGRLKAATVILCIFAAMSVYNARQWQTNESLWKSCLRHGDSTWVSYQLAQDYYQNRRFLQAVPLLEKVAKKYPNNLKARYHLADCLNKIGDNNSAITHLKYILERDADNTQAKKLLAAIYLAQ
ncbi:MAG: tetratricopeptide repeat protein [Lentisphaeria bacterium]|nr:tetratricopeptide repeat protein [Lentisphaeria bacterium]